MITSIYPQPQAPINASEAKSVRFPEDIQIIIRADRPQAGNLFLSNIEAAQNTQILQNLQIKAVVTAAKGHKLKHPKNIIEFTKYLPLEDDDKCNIEEFLDEACTFISDRLKHTNVLVHCIAGVSRSAAIVIAFLMRERKLNLEDAYNEAKSRRRTICLSQNILEQLQRYQLRRGGKDLNVSNRLNTAAKMDTQSRFNGNTFLNTKTNQSELNKSFLKVKTDQKELNQSAFRVMTNQAEVNRSSIKNKTNQDELRRSTVQDKSNIYAKVLPDDIDEIKSRKSHMSHRTQKTGHQINILAPIEVKNPEESFISRKSGIKNHTQLDKSFASSRPRSEKKSDLDFFSSKEASVKGNKLSESRHQFTKKMNRVDSLNERLNEKFEIVQERFDTETKSHKQALEGELAEIYRLKANLYSQYQSERKASKAASVHNQTMEDKQVKQYILNTLQDHIL